MLHRVTDELREGMGAKRSSKPMKAVKIGESKFPGSSVIELKMSTVKSDKSTVYGAGEQFDEALVECLLRSGSECLQELSALAEDMNRCLGEENERERAFVIEVAQLCLRQAIFKANAQIAE